MEKNKAEDMLTGKVIDILLKVGALFLVLLWCFQIIRPFINIVVWAIIIAITLYPLQGMLSKRLGEKPKLASTFIFTAIFLLFLVPIYFLGDSMLEGVQNYSGAFQNNELKLPAPPQRVEEIPLVGEQLYKTWTEASNNLPEVVLTHKTQVAALGKAVLKGIMSTAGGMVQMLISFIVAAIMLASSSSASGFGHQFYRRLIGGQLGDEFARISEITIRNVAKGILGVSVIQALALGIAFLLAGVPYAGLWALFCLILCVIQIGPAPIVIPVIIYVFSIHGTAVSVIWTIVLVALMLMDNVLKPMLMGKGAPVPMLVIFLGAIGGFMASGFIGMFIGAIILSLGYKLFIAWLNADSIVE